MIHASTGGLVNLERIFETYIVQNIDDTRMFSDRDGHAYMNTGFALYRITFPGVTSVSSPERPPLPLSIGRPYPHPVSRATEFTTLFIQSEHASQVTMTVHDLAGRELGRLFDGELGPEGRHLTWSIRTLTPGTYLLQLASEEGVCRRKVVVE